MNSAVVFFSYQGNTRRIAQELASELGSDLIELQPLRRRRPIMEPVDFVWGGVQVRMPATPGISHPEFDLDAYDLLIIATPVWAGSIAPPVRTFLESHEFFRKQFGFLVTYAGRVGATLDHLREHVLGNEVVGELSLRDDTHGDGSALLLEARAWAREVLAAARAEDHQEASGE